MDSLKGLPIIDFETQPAWDEWLAENHAVSPGLWIKIAKKGADLPTVSYAQALETALCYGWIDGQKASFDDRFWLQRFSRRTARSKWSKINREQADRLIEAGKMRPAGLAEIERACRDGRWEQAYAPQSGALVPEDFQAALAENPRAAAFFAGLDSKNRYAILYRIQDAKRPETRARRIAKFVAMLNDHQTFY